MSKATAKALAALMTRLEEHAAEDIKFQKSINTTAWRIVRAMIGAIGTAALLIIVGIT